MCARVHGYIILENAMWLAVLSYRYAPGARGNVATESVHERLTALGYDTGLDSERIAAAGQFARSICGK